MSKLARREYNLSISHNALHLPIYQTFTYPQLLQIFLHYLSQGKAIRPRLTQKH